MSSRPLFVLAILASSFLIFLVQPMVGKRILPWFGGTPSVWTLCLAFYQTTLFLGYAYAHLLVRFASPGAQLAIHGLVVVAAFLALPVLPGDVWKSVDVVNPSLDVIKMLNASVALPFVALASTGPLVQAWFARSFPGRSPFPLYAVSNFGSFAALLAYPFFIEPWLPLSTTGTLWTFAFAATAIAVLGCASIARLAQQDSLTQGIDEVPEGSGRTTPVHVVMWILLAGSAVILLMGVTNSVCLDVASVPFLWILPLATYLMTFILCFGSETNYRPLPYAILTIGAFGLTIGLGFLLRIAAPVVDETDLKMLSTTLLSIFVQIPAYCALLFGTCMILHGELYRLRPTANDLTGFYLCVSGGGALGGLFAGIIAPLIFDDYYEIRVGLALAAMLSGAIYAMRPTAAGLEKFRGPGRRIAAVLASLLVLYILVPSAIDREVVIHRERSFFGVLRVVQLDSSKQGFQRRLVSGTTLHGVQFTDESGPLLIPSSYFGRATGIAAALERRTRDRPLNVGLIGLGVGTIAAYGRSGDHFRYYEIDPAVAFIAGNAGYFSFLSQSRAEVEVVLGDARIEIEKEQRGTGSQGFDFLVLDAFNSDAIPVHLLTVEAFRSYAEALAENGVLAVHATNRYFDLVPLVARVGSEVGFESLVISTRRAPQFRSQQSDWIFLSSDSEPLQNLADEMRQRTNRQKLPSGHATLRRLNRSGLEDVPVWTDDYSDLLSVVRTD